MSEKTATDMATDLYERFKIRIVFRDVGPLHAPSDYEGMIKAIGQGFGASPIYGLGDDEEGAYDDVLAREGKAYKWHVVFANEVQAAKIVKTNYQLSDAKVSGKTVNAQTGEISYIDLLNALKKAKASAFVTLE